ncbi:MAG TPA: ATP-dependent helicase [Phycisphaerales bacterium]|nr:ATP-dependent helicase [Phycisphaerales bacterium]
MTSPSNAEFAPAAHPLDVYDLDAQQHAAVTTAARRVVVRAGPGAGKTRVLVARLRHLLDLGFEPHRILALAFTRRAAEEVRARLDVPLECQPLVTTFHGWYLALVEANASVVGLLPGVTVRDRDEVEALAVQIGAERRHRHRSAARLLEDPEIAQLVRTRLRDSNSVSYDDLEALALKLLRDGVARPSLAHVLVDEAQDTSPHQQEVLSHLAAGRTALAPSADLFLVGDTSQAIYRFRGGDPDGFLRLGENAARYELRANYRSSWPVVAAAARAQLTPPPVPQYTVDDEQPGWTGTIHEWDFAEHVRNVCGGEWGRCAVLLPTWNGANWAAVQLEGEGIPHIVARRGTTWTTPHGRSVIAALRVVGNPHDRLSLEQLIGSAARTPAWHRALADAIERGRPVVDAGLEAAAGLPIAARVTLARSALARGVPPHDVAADLVAGGPDEERQLAALDAAQGCRTVADLLAVLQDEGSALPPQGERVLLSTIHGVKGAEWDHIWVGGFDGARGDVEDLRRLLYVATTRARRTCAWIVDDVTRPPVLVAELLAAETVGRP